MPAARMAVPFTPVQGRSISPTAHSHRTRLPAVEYSLWQGQASVEPETAVRFTTRAGRCVRWERASLPTQPREALLSSPAGPTVPPSVERFIQPTEPLNFTTLFLRQTKRSSDRRRGILDRRLREGERFMRIEVRLFWLDLHSQTMNAKGIWASAARRRATEAPFSASRTFLL